MVRLLNLRENRFSFYSLMRELISFSTAAFWLFFLYGLVSDEFDDLLDEFCSVWIPDILTF